MFHKHFNNNNMVANFFSHFSQFSSSSSSCIGLQPRPENIIKHREIGRIAQRRLSFFFNARSRNHKLLNRPNWFSFRRRLFSLPKCTRLTLVFIFFMVFFLYLYLIVSFSFGCLFEERKPKNQTRAEKTVSSAC